MKIIKWVILVVIAAALVFGAYQGFLLNRGLSELGKRADIQSDTLGRYEEKIADLEQVNKDMGNKLEQMNRELSELGKRADLQSDTLGRCEERIVDLEQVNEEMQDRLAPGLFDVITGLSKGKFHRYRKDPVLCPGTPGEWDESGSGELSIIRKDSIYYLYYDGWNAAGVHQIGLATSTDLTKWTKEPTNPVLTVSPGEWDEDCVEDMTVIYFPRATEYSPIVGEWKMWYEGKGAGKCQVGYATSNDGITWSKYAGNPLIPNGSDPVVIVHKGTYYMIYYGIITFPETLMNFLATSPDGSTWTKQGEILAYSAKPDDWTAWRIEIISLYHLGDYILALVRGVSDNNYLAPNKTGYFITSVVLPIYR